MFCLFDVMGFADEEQGLRVTRKAAASKRDPECAIAAIAKRLFGNIMEVKEPAPSAPL